MVTAQAFRSVFEPAQWAQVGWARLPAGHGAAGRGVARVRSASEG
jgi:hypothetical protein